VPFIFVVNHNRGVKTMNVLDMSSYEIDNRLAEVYQYDGPLGNETLSVIYLARVFREFGQELTWTEVAEAIKTGDCRLYGHYGTLGMVGFEMLDAEDRAWVRHEFGLDAQMAVWQGEDRKYI
jgi:hypothetical protein